QNPARNSFDSTNGPSVKIASPPRLSITVAESGVPRPPANTQCPSATSLLLNTSIAASSSSVARPASSQITETRHCIPPPLQSSGGTPPRRPLTHTTNTPPPIRQPRRAPREPASRVSAPRGTHGRLRRRREGLRIAGVLFLVPLAIALMFCAKTL